MRGIAKSLSETASVIVLASAALLMAPCAASAQINIPGILGSMAHGYYGGQYRTRRGKVHETKRTRRSKEANEEDSNKEDHSGKEDHSADESDQGSKGHQEEDKATTKTTAAESTPKQNVSQPASNNAPAQPTAGMPSFTPER